MKKCASCSKDLPDAALHCVFCGAKQAPAPAQPAGLQKTVMGYSAQEMLAQMRAQGVPPGTPGAPSAPSAPVVAPVVQPAPLPLPVMQPAAQSGLAPPAAPPGAPTLFDPTAAPRPATPSQPPPMGPRGSVDATLPPAGFPEGGSPNAPHAAHGSLDATLPPAGFPQGFNPQAEARAQAQALGMAPSGATPLGAPVFGPASGPMPVMAPSPMPAHAMLTPVAPAPAHLATPNYRPNATPLGGDPLGAGLRMWSLVFGLLVIIAFVMPVSLSPVKFLFSDIGPLFDGPIRPLLAVLLFPAIGLLAIVFGALPMGTAARGAVVGVLGLAGFGVGYAFSSHLAWQQLASELGMVFLLTGLVMRGGYPASLLARILVTLGALAYLAPWLVPGPSGGLPLVDKLQGLGDLPTAALVATAVALATVVLSVASLLAWLPRSSGGGAKVFYWTLLILVAIAPMIGLLVEAGADVLKSPAEAFAWTGELAIYGLASYGLGALLGRLTE